MFVALWCFPILGCAQEWPPHADEVYKEFHRVRPALDSAKKTLEGGNLVQVDVLPDEVYGRSNYDALPIRLSDEDAKPFRDSLRDSGLVGVFRTDRGVYVLASGGDRDHGSYRYRWDFAYPKLEPLSDCGDEPTVDCGACALKMDGGWYVEYRWKPIGGANQSACADFRM